MHNANAFIVNSSHEFTNWVNSTQCFEIKKRKFFFFFQPTRPEPIGYPSALSTTLSHQLIHPIFTFSASIQKSSSYFAYFQGLKKTLPCDTHVVNLKMLQENILQQASDTAALFLHRIGYDCRFRWRCSEKKVSSSMRKFSCNYYIY